MGGRYKPILFMSTEPHFYFLSASFQTKHQAYLLLSHQVVSNSPRPHGLQQARLSVLSFNCLQAHYWMTNYYVLSLRRCYVWTGYILYLHTHCRLTIYIPAARELESTPTSQMTLESRERLSNLPNAMQK